MTEEGYFTPKYENITLPDDIRGKVKTYKENIYESPIQTSAGKTHFGYTTDKYFGHTRIEDMADNKTRRVIEVQSDLYQKGSPTDKVKQMLPSTDEVSSNLSPEKAKRYRELVKITNNITPNLAEERSNLFFEAKKNASVKEAGKLLQYNDPTAHFRMIREEIKKAAQDGKTKLQFPTGETAMKIEGLGDNTQWMTGSGMRSTDVTPDSIKIGQEIYQGHDDWVSGNNGWIITDVLGDGKFKAVPKSYQEAFDGKSISQGVYDTHKEQFDISGKVDTNNPIYKFYEKDVAKYLNKFGGKRVVDDKGVSWIEIPITKEQGKMPVEAFGIIATTGLGAGVLSKKETNN